MTKAEKLSLGKINQRLESNHNRIEEQLLRKYESIRGNDGLLPHQKALLLKNELGSMNIAEGDFLPIFDELYGNVDAVSLETASDMVRLSQGSAAGRISSRDQVIKYWREDSQARMQKWGKAYEQQAQALFELSYQQNWGARRTADELNVLLGRTEKNAARIVRSSGNSVRTLTMKQGYDANNIEFVIWNTSGSDKVCPYCSARNQQVYKIGEAIVPAHVNCQCYLLPFKKEWVQNGKFDKEWSKESRRKGLEELNKAGGAANNGLTPFEKSMGLDKPPKPVWTAEKGFARGEAPRVITKPQLRYLSLSELKALAQERGLSADRVKELGKTGLGKRATWIRAIAADSRG
ncbi:hypothetical protein [Anabaena lutea]|uniref:Phage head morphogenesis domain-containing protein n=1 Tax=Anabaena lutea FACHB-196 TaxID=2692881 RepID=A0ABR8FIH1_9NOST|nr:hypothetical protein [Anabaena lutea]MBD2570042.1 hypothetical protein [Anabaena lutea FACHB-196]